MPSASQTALSKARQVFTEHGGMLRTTEALHLGIHPRDLYFLRDRGEVEEVARGLYRLAAAPQLTSPDLVSVSVRVADSRRPLQWRRTRVAPKERGRYLPEQRRFHRYCRAGGR